MKKNCIIHPSEATSILKYFTQEFFAETKIIILQKAFCAHQEYAHWEPKKFLKKFYKKPKTNKKDIISLFSTK